MDCCDSDSGVGLPQKYNLRSRLAGDTWQGVNFTITVNDDPVDFTDCVVEMAFRKSSKIGKLMWLLSSESGDISVASNTISILSRLLTLDPGRYVYDLQVTFPDNVVRTYVQGNFEVLRDITF